MAGIQTLRDSLKQWGVSPRQSETAWADIVLETGIMSVDFRDDACLSFRRFRGHLTGYLAHDLTGRSASLRI